MKFQINQKGGGTLKLKFLLLFFLILFSCATVPTKNYDETVSEWKSYKDVAKWMSRHFSYDMKKFKAEYSYDNPMLIRTPKETFELKSGVCFDAARFAKETLNRIDPSYEAEIVFIHREILDHYVCSFSWQDDPGGDCPRIAGKPAERKPLVQTMEAWGQRRTARRGPSGSQTEVGTTTTATCRGGTAKGSQGPRFCHRFVDTASRSGCYRTIDRSALSPGTCVEDPRIDGLDTAATGQASEGAQSGESETMG